MHPRGPHSCPRSRSDVLDNSHFPGGDPPSGNYRYFYLHLPTYQYGDLVSYISLASNSCDGSFIELLPNRTGDNGHDLSASSCSAVLSRPQGPSGGGKCPVHYFPSCTYKYLPSILA